MKRLTAYVTPETHDWIERQAKDRQIPVAQWVRGLIDQEYLKNNHSFFGHLPTFGCRHRNRYIRPDEVVCSDCGAKL